MKNRILSLVAFLFIQFLANAQAVKWSGAANDGLWANPLNWSGQNLPTLSDSVVLDHSLLTTSYKVVLPAGSIQIRALVLESDSTQPIELEIPATSNSIAALLVTGPIKIGPFSQITNRSTVSGGSAIQCNDSIYVFNKGSYVHRSASPHAALLNGFSKSNECAYGQVCFDVPGTASYTLSLSNRTLGKLILQSKTAGGARTYVATGVNPVLLKGGLQIDSGTTLSYNATSTVHVFDDFIVEGILNMGPGANAIALKLYKGWYGQGQLVESGTGLPSIELIGTSLQRFAFKGIIKDQIALTSNNSNGILLDQPLTVGYGIRLLKGVIYSSNNAPFILDSNATVLADTGTSTAYVEGVVMRKGMKLDQSYLIPIGKDKYQRWIKLKGISGDFSIQYTKQAASMITAVIDSSLKRVSGVEYWTVNGIGAGNLKAELSFNSVNSGGVTNLNALQVAYTTGWMWLNGGNTGTTGSAGASGSVWSDTLPFVSGSSLHLTLASAIKQENPLPIQFLRLYSKPLTEHTLIGFTVSEIVDVNSFLVQLVLADGSYQLLKEIVPLPSKYNYELPVDQFETAIGFRVIAKKYGSELVSVVHRFPRWYQNVELDLKVVKLSASEARLYCYANTITTAAIQIHSELGRRVYSQRVVLQKGLNSIPIPIHSMRSGWYAISMVSPNFGTKTLKMSL